MAQRTQVFLTDDLDGTNIPAGKGETIAFALDGRTIKEWARANGYEVNDRGRIPNDIREAFDAAN